MVLAATQGRTVYSHAFGLADRWHGVVPTENTSFRIGSLTKGFTAVAVLSLAHAFEAVAPWSGARPPALAISDRSAAAPSAEAW